MVTKAGRSGIEPRNIKTQGIKSKYSLMKARTVFRLSSDPSRVFNAVLTLRAHNAPYNYSIGDKRRQKIMGALLDVIGNTEKPHQALQCLQTTISEFYRKNNDYGWHSLFKDLLHSIPQDVISILLEKDLDIGCLSDDEAKKASQDLEMSTLMDLFYRVRPDDRQRLFKKLSHINILSFIGGRRDSLVNREQNTSFYQFAACIMVLEATSGKPCPDLFAAISNALKSSNGKILLSILEAADFHPSLVKRFSSGNLEALWKQAEDEFLAAVAENPHRSSGLLERMAKSDFDFGESFYQAIAELPNYIQFPLLKAAYLPYRFFNAFETDHAEGYLRDPYWKNYIERNWDYFNSNLTDIFREMGYAPPREKEEERANGGYIRVPNNMGILISRFGFREDMTQKEAKRLHRQLVKALHPDRNDTSGERIRRLNAAWGDAKDNFK
ncbi:MAG: J domain-containing protein [Candidatus Margulisiibacteriota bacterium]